MANSLTDEGDLHPALARAFAAFPAASARRAAAALSTILRQRRAQDGTACWSSSRLTGDGFPVELAFTTGDARLRYTTEVSSARLAPAQRLSVALTLLRSLAQIELPAREAAWLGALQQQGPLQYGAWLGGRHSANDDQYKLYIELPAAVRGLGALHSGLVSPRFGDQALLPRMLAYSPATESYEVYYRARALAPHLLPRLLQHCKLEAHADALLGLLERAYGRTLRDKLPGPSVGVSYALVAGRPATLTLFLYARSLWGCDARIRSKFSEAAQHLAADTDSYRRVTAPLAQRQGPQTRHGMVGWTSSSGGVRGLNVGVRPE